MLTVEFYILKSIGRPAETNPPEGILPDEKCDVIALEAVQCNDELMHEAVNPETWKLFLSCNMASTRAVPDLANRHKQVFKACKWKEKHGTTALS